MKIDKLGRRNHGFTQQAREARAKMGLLKQPIYTTKAIAVRLDPDDDTFIRAKAKKENTTCAEILRTYIAWAIDEER